VPFYTPEPDIVHEIIGHAQMLASPVFADLYRAAGQASRRAETDAALEFFSKVFWCTLEFGVVWEPGPGDVAELKTYGAGLLSSYGEITEFRGAEIRPWDLGAMGTTTYDITTYQPVLYAAPSFDEMVDRLGQTVVLVAAAVERADDLVAASRTAAVVVVVVEDEDEAGG
jgi:phenylalanine-4-hydroxylase